MKICRNLYILTSCIYITYAIKEFVLLKNLCPPVLHHVNNYKKWNMIVYSSMPINILRNISCRKKHNFWKKQNRILISRSYPNDMNTEQKKNIQRKLNIKSIFIEFDMLYYFILKVIFIVILFRIICHIYILHTLAAFSFIFIITVCTCASLCCCCCCFFYFHLSLPMPHSLLFALHISVEHIE